MRSMSPPWLWLIVGHALTCILMLITGVGLAFVLAGLERRESPLLVGQGALLGHKGALRLRGLSLVFVDALKLLFKEDLIPPRAHRGLFVLAPVWCLAGAVLMGSVIPLGPPLCPAAVTEVLAEGTCAAAWPLQALPVPDGLLVFAALSVASAFGLAMAGWASRSKWALLSSLRASFQAASFAVPMGLGVLSVAVLFGSFDLAALVERQGAWPWQWGVWGVPHVMAFVVVWTALILGTPRTPLRLDDGRSDAIGCLVEYSGVRAGLFRLAELMRAVFASALVVTLFFGGWRFPGFEGLSARWPSGLVVFVGFAVFCVKVTLACAVQLLARGSVVRPRPDQVLDLVWRRLVPFGALTLLVSGLWRLLGCAEGGA